MPNKIIILLLFLCAGHFGHAQNKSSITVKVVERYKDTPIAGVTLTLYKGNKKMMSVKSDQKGQYCFKDLEPGAYRITSTYKGYASADMDDIMIEKPMMITGKIEIQPCINGPH